ncbi:efflux RND transporter periplasmic adaptor subunit [Verrucomicrobia bacterium S94]|nr:efflux RND transporter periplasmic adaptor subunit [Verrucomicrobia bacterium S94]
MPAKRKYNVKGTNDFIVLAAIFFFLCLWAIKDAWFPSEKVLRKHPLEMMATFEVDGTVEDVLVEVGDSVGEGQVIARLRSDRIAEEYEKAKKEFTEKRKKHQMMELARKNAEKNGVSDQGYADIVKSEEEALAAREKAHARVTELKNKIDSAVLLSPTKGKVVEIRVGAHTMVDRVPAEFDGTVALDKESRKITVTGADGQLQEFTAGDTQVFKVHDGDEVAAGDVLAADAAVLIDPKDHFYLFNKSLAIFSFFAFWTFLAIHILGR